MKIKNIVITTLAVVGISGLGYTYWNQSHFAADTKVNGVSVANLTAAKAAKKINDATQNRQLTFKDKQITKKIDISSNKKISDDDLKPLIKQTHHSNKRNLTTDNTDSLKKIAYKQYPTIKAFVTELNLNRRVARPISAELVNRKLTSIKAVKGNYIDKKQLLHDFKESASDATNINLTAKYKGESKKLHAVNQKAIDNMKWARNSTLAYSLNGKDYKLSGKKYLMNGQLVNHKWKVDPTNLVVALTKLDKKHSNVHKPMQFKTATGVMITTNNTAESNYGWSIDTSAEANDLLNTWLDHKTEYKAKNIIGNGYMKPKETLKSGNYIEVNLSTLTEYVFKNHKKIAKIPVMSGLVGKQTPIGLFHVLYKESPSTLRGYNDDGTKYASKVQYWVPITEDGVGLHDSPWQPSLVYGDPASRNAYHSHGCINNPPSKMPIIWKNTYTNMPVIIHA